jgi:Ca2+-binding EF-hand superfamily protein
MGRGGGRKGGKIAKNQAGAAARSKQQNAAFEEIIRKFDDSVNGKVDMDELRKILTDLDPNKRPPLPKDLLVKVLKKSAYY